MTDRTIPHPTPVALLHETNALLRSDEMGSRLDDNARFIVRRMVADAYALGFSDGRLDQQINADTDEYIRRHADDETARP
jgi:hypothetical protein